MAAELTSTDYAFLIILTAEGREISNTEMDKRYQVRLISPAYEKLNAGGLVASDTTRRPYRHVITKSGAGLLADPLSIDEDQADGEKRSLREKQLWAAVVAQQNELVRLRSGAPPVVEEPADLGGRIRAAYAKLAAPGDWVSLTALRPLLADVSKADLDKALTWLHDSVPDVLLEPEPFGHRVGADERNAAVHIGGEDRHKLAIGRR
jgi:hypothetical protein